MKKLERLKISQMQDFSVIESNEQIALKGGGGPSWWSSLLSLIGMGGDDNSTNTTYQSSYGTGDNVGGNQYNFDWNLVEFNSGSETVSADSIQSGYIQMTGQDSIRYNGQEYVIYGDSVVIKTY